MSERETNAFFWGDVGILGGGRKKLLHEKMTKRREKVPLWLQHLEKKICRTDLLSSLNSRKTDSQSSLFSLLLSICSLIRMSSSRSFTDFSFGFRCFVRQFVSGRQENPFLSAFPTPPLSLLSLTLLFLFQIIWDTSSSSFTRGLLILLSQSVALGIREGGDRDADRKRMRVRPGNSLSLWTCCSTCGQTVLQQQGFTDFFLRLFFESLCMPLILRTTACGSETWVGSCYHEEIERSSPVE